MKKPTNPQPAPMMTVWDRAIIRAAFQAQERLRTRSLSPQEVREALYLLRLGQDLVMRLQGYGVQLPQIDLSYSPPSTAAATSDIEGREAAAKKKLEQGGGR